jgi:hypothetical protein
VAPGAVVVGSDVLCVGCSTLAKRERFQLEEDPDVYADADLDALAAAESDWQNERMR